MLVIFIWYLICPTKWLLVIILDWGLYHTRDTGARGNTLYIASVCNITLCGTDILWRHKKI